jgi:hypothetical protein
MEASWIKGGAWGAAPTLHKRLKHYGHVATACGFQLRVPLGGECMQSIVHRVDVRVKLHQLRRVALVDTAALVEDVLVLDLAACGW